jgi:hypothetical protein
VRLNKKAILTLFLASMIASSIAMTRSVYAATLNVPVPFATITAAIAAANPLGGDTIVVAAGVYNEQIVINKPVTIVGAGAATTTITGNFVGNAPGVPVVTIDAPGSVSFSGFTITGAPPSLVGPNFDRFGMLAKQTVAAAGSTYTISDCKFVGINNPVINNDYQFYASVGSEAIVFTRNVITQYSGNGILSEIHTGPTEISYNTIDAPLCSNSPADTIFFMTYGGHDVTTLQNFAHNTFNMGTANLKSTAISIAAPGPDAAQGNAKYTNIAITENTITGLKANGRGIGFWNGNVGYPAPPDGAKNNIINPVVTKNSIQGTSAAGSFGISFYDDFGSTTGATISCNTIKSMAYGIYLRAGDAPGTKISGNNLMGNTVGIDWTIGLAPVNAIDNYWGSPTGPTNIANPGGTGDTATANVVFAPWLQNPSLCAPGAPAHPVGGEWAPISMVQLVAPWILLAFIAIAGVAVGSHRLLKKRM